MKFQISSIQSSLAELFAQASNSGCLTLNDRYVLKAALLRDSLSEEETIAIDRLLYAVRRGWLKMGDNLTGLA